MGIVFDLTPEILRSILIGNTHYFDWYDSIVRLLPTYGFSTKKQMAAFLSQTMVESAFYEKLKENLNYSAQGLIRTFPTHFKNEELSLFANQPQKIANRVYSNRYGNGDELSGDGWKFCGRGLIQVTFRSNYKAYSEWAYKDDRVLDNPDMLCNPEDALKSAIWFWNTHNLSKMADNDQMTSITKCINGGTNGLPQRINLYNKVLSVI